MKKMLRFCVVSVLAALALSLGGCDDDDMVGNLKVVFVHPPSTVYIYPICATEHILELESDRNVFKCTLNMGDYLLRPSGSRSYLETAFQIRSGETTVVSYDENNRSKVR